jgi:hypothetical protein
MIIKWKRLWRCLRLQHAGLVVAALLLVFGLALFGLERSARAAEPAPPANSSAPTAAQKETARTWLREGYELLEQKQYSGALERFSAAYRLVRVPTTGLAVASAQEGLGLWVEANATAMEVINMPPQPDEPEVFGRAREDARALWERLSRLVPSVRVDVTPVDAAARISIDGTEMPSAAGGMAFKLNPGEHRLLVTAAGHAPAERTFRLGERDDQQLSVMLTPDPYELQPASPVPGAGVVAAPADPAAAPVDVDTGSAARTRAYVALGVAGVATLTGSVTGILAFSSKPDCPDDECTLDQKEDADASKRFGTVATVSFGVAALAGGYALWELLANVPSEPMTTGSIALPGLVPTQSGALIEVSGAF